MTTCHNEKDRPRSDGLFANMDEEEDDPWDVLREEGRLVGRHEWDSGGPGAGAGTVDVWLYSGSFYSDNDVEPHGPFETFLEAAEVVGLFHVNEATTNIWVDPEFCDCDVVALNLEAAEKRRLHEEKWRKPKS
jgi:hypothetical protein